MRELIDRDYPRAPVIRVVMDNFLTHSAGAIFDTPSRRTKPTVY